MMQNRSLGQRIGLGYLLVGLLVLLASSLGFVYIGLVSRTMAVTEQGLQQFEDLGQMERSWATVATTVDRMLLTRQTGGAIQVDLEQAMAAFEQELTDLAAQPDLVAQNPQAVAALQLLGAQLVDQVEEITAVARDGRWSRAQVIRHTEMNSLQRRFEENLTLLRLDTRQNVTTAVAAARQLQNTLRLIWIGTVVLVAVVSIVAGIRVVRSVTEPVNELIAQTRRVTQRDFSPITPLAQQDELGQLSRAFAEMTDLLRGSYGELEGRVADRTRALLASIEISRRLTTILDPDELVDAIVAQIDAAFGYYHTHVYLFDETGSYLTLVAGSGQVGRQMMAQGHRIEQGQGLVGRAAESAAPVLVSDVSQAQDWLPNPLLPETKAETAVPILVGQQVLGVLDVQHNIVDGLQQEDVDLLQSVANQIAVALRNAQLYNDAEKRARREARIRAINAQILSTTDMETAMKVAAREVGQTLGVHKTMVRLLTHSPQEGVAAQENGRHDPTPSANDRENQP
jgi:putative methionine-R-sulfoxide reductase with GAF domain/HAMP domain-containing protein